MMRNFFATASDLPVFVFGFLTPCGSYLSSGLMALRQLLAQLLERVNIIAFSIRSFLRVARKTARDATAVKCQFARELITTHSHPPGRIAL